MTAEKDTDASLARNIPRLYAVKVLATMHFFGPVIVPFFTDWGGLSLGQVFYLNAWFMLCICLLEVPTGTVADFLGRKTSLAMGCLLGGVACAVYASTPHLGAFILGEFIFAAAFALQSGADDALAYDSLKGAGLEHRAARAIPRMEAYKLAGVNAAALAGGFIATWGGLRAPMLAYTVPALAAAALAFTLREPPCGNAGPNRRGYWQILADGGRFFVTHPGMLRLSLELAFTHALCWAAIWLYQPALEALGMPLRYFGFVQATACFGQMALLANADRLEALLGGKRRLLTGMTVAAGAAYVALALTRHPGVAIAAVVAAFSFGLPRASIYVAHLNRGVPSAQRATVLSFVSMCRTLAIAAISPLIGLCVEGSVHGTLLTAGVLLMASPWIARVAGNHKAALMQPRPGITTSWCPAF